MVCIHVPEFETSAADQKMAKSRWRKDDDALVRAARAPPPPAPPRRVTLSS